MATHFGDGGWEKARARERERKSALPVGLHAKHVFVQDSRLIGQQNVVRVFTTKLAAERYYTAVLGFCRTRVGSGCGLGFEFGLGLDWVGSRERCKIEAELSAKSSERGWSVGVVHKCGCGTVLHLGAPVICFGGVFRGSN